MSVSRNAGCPSVAVTLLVVGAVGWTMGCGAVPAPPPGPTPTRTLADLGQIIFTGMWRGVGVDILTVQADGSSWGKVTQQSGANWCPAWSPDGQQIAFSSKPDDGVGGLYVMNADGSAYRQLLPTDWGIDTPAWSPDGTHIAITVAITNGHYDTGDIAMLDLATRHVTPLIQGPANDRGPAWSPDGQRIAFASDRDPPGRHQIYSVKVDGSDLTRLTDEQESGAGDPAWSPDGRRIAYTCYREGTERVCVMNADGSQAVQLTRQADFQSGAHPSWSPDGLRIVYEQGRGGHYDLWVMNADGSDPQQLTHATQMGLVYAGCARWQPRLPP